MSHVIDCGIGEVGDGPEIPDTDLVLGTPLGPLVKPDRLPRRCGRRVDLPCSQAIGASSNSFVLASLMSTNSKLFERPDAPSYRKSDAPASCAISLQIPALARPPASAGPLR